MYSIIFSLFEKVNSAESYRSPIVVLFRQRIHLGKFLPGEG
jgi:hypothetical protein